MGLPGGGCNVFILFVHSCLCAMGPPGGGCHVFILFVHSCLWLRWACLVEVVMFLSCLFTAVCDWDGRAWWRLSCFYLVCSQLFVTAMGPPGGGCNVFILFLHSCLWLQWAHLVEVVMFLSCMFTAVCVRWACLVEVVMFLSCLFTAVCVRWACLVEVVMFLSCLFTAVCDCDGPTWWRL